MRGKSYPFWLIVKVILGSPRPNLAHAPEHLQNDLPVVALLPGVLEEVLTVRVVLADLLQTPLHEPLHVLRVRC